MTTDGKDRTSARRCRCGRLDEFSLRLAESAEEGVLPLPAPVAATSSGTTTEITAKATRRTRRAPRTVLGRGVRGY